MSQRRTKPTKRKDSFSDKVRAMFGVSPDDRLSRTQGKFTEEKKRSRKKKRGL